MDQDVYSFAGSTTGPLPGETSFDRWDLISLHDLGAALGPLGRLLSAPSDPM